MHAAQGSTADGVIAVMDSGYGPLTDQSTFYVEISRARDSVVVLTDNRDQLVEVLEANTGERASALEAIGERIEPGAEELAGLVLEKVPVWTPREEWKALEARARFEGTVLFRMEGYEALIARTRKLALLPDLPAAIRAVADGLLAYDRACREQAAAAREFLGLLDAHTGRRRELEEAAGARDCAVAELADYPDWRAMAGRLLVNGEALLADMGGGAPDGGGRIAERLGQLSESLALESGPKQPLRGTAELGGKRAQ